MRFLKRIIRKKLKSIFLFVGLSSALTGIGAVRERQNERQENKPLSEVIGTSPVLQEDDGFEIILEKKGDIITLKRIKTN